MTDVPHFKIPFQFGSYVEQDSSAEVAQCVECIVRTRVGERLDLPEFGIEDPALQPAPLDTDPIHRAVERWEPRASVLLSERPDLYDESVRVVTVRMQEDGTSD